uniref:ABC transporter domain-containing protein n=1 Tax=Glossina pallidipes TaxID=7398 RepID=A0A1A9Z8L3_GLOPL
MLMQCLQNQGRYKFGQLIIGYQTRHLSIGGYMNKNVKLLNHTNTHLLQAIHLPKMQLIRYTGYRANASAQKTGMSGNVIIISVLYYGGTLVVSNVLSIGELTSISINGLSNFYTKLNKGNGSAQRIWEILDRKYEIPLNFGIIPSEKRKGQVIFDNVKFCFPARPKNIVLDNFTLVLRPGETTALVGRSGSGKTTIATLLLRLYDPLNGRIVLDDVDLRDLSPIWLRSHIGAVNQEPVLFSGTIRDNILYGLNPNVNFTESHLEEAVRRAHVDEFSSQLPDGLDTLRGVLLSGGQKQTVAIARALINVHTSVTAKYIVIFLSQNPTILILDEATSALDSVSEELVQNALDELAKGRICLTIAHRLSAIRNANTIAVLDNGHVIEQGSYEQLITQNVGTFKELVNEFMMKKFLVYTKSVQCMLRVICVK